MRMDSIHGFYGVKPRDDSEKGSVFWFEIPYRPDETTAKTVRPILSLSNMDAFQSSFKEMGFEELGTISTNEQFPPIEEHSHESGTNSHVFFSTSSRSSTDDQHAATIVPMLSTTFTETSELKVDGSSQCNTPSSSPQQNSRNTMKTSPALFAPNLPRWNILIVDDSPTIVKMISMMLRQQKHKVTIAENGSVGLQKIMGHCEEHGKGYDLVLMDLQMPVMDGLEATRRCRKSELESRLRGPNPFSKVPHTHHQIIIGMSANSDHETMKEAFHAGVDDFITKPFCMNVFTQTVMKVIDGENEGNP
jgi:CheY-like chemotaxis protein